MSQVVDGLSAVQREATTAAQARFLDAFVECGGNLTAAAEAAEVGRRTVYTWRAADAAFRAALEVAEEEAIERLEREVFRRAIDGVEEPVHYQGRQVSTVRRFSDTLLLALLRRRSLEWRASSGVPTSVSTLNVVTQVNVGAEQAQDRARQILEDPRLAAIAGQLVAAFTSESDAGVPGGAVLDVEAESLGDE